MQNTRESSKYKKMFEWGGAAKEEYYISVSKKFKVVSPRIRNERKWNEFLGECSPKMVHCPVYYLGID